MKAGASGIEHFPGSVEPEAATNRATSGMHHRPESNGTHCNLFFVRHMRSKTPTECQNPLLTKSTAKCGNCMDLRHGDDGQEFLRVHTRRYFPKYSSLLSRSASSGNTLMITSAPPLPRYLSFGMMAFRPSSPGYLSRSSRPKA